VTIQSQIDGAFVEDHDAWLEQAMLAYRSDGASVGVNFRELVPSIRPGTDRYTHLMHPYPAKLLAAIPHLFMRCGSIVPQGGRVLDPFCGSGTVLLEAALAGHRADGADANPLARLIAAVKLTRIDAASLRQALDAVLAGGDGPAARPDVVNIAHWFADDVIARLSSIRAGVVEIGDPAVRRFFEACLSACARRVSFADPRLSVPVRLNAKRLDVYGAKGAEALGRLKALTGPQVTTVFRGIAEQNIDRLARLDEAEVWPEPPVLFEDARRLGEGDWRYDLVVTSPPYAGAQKYIRSSSLGLGWLGLTPGGRLRELERLNIGREHYSIGEYAEVQPTGCVAADAVIGEVRERNPLRAHIASNYLVEMKAAFAEMARVTRPSGWLVLVSGRNLVCGTTFDTPAYLEDIATAVGFRTRARLVDDIRSRGLMTKRNRTAGLISQEVVTVMQRNG
jgi:DNA modification methylase